MKKYRFELILFVVDAICMILELIASRILSPYFGDSNFVWTGVIGIILLSSSIGNYYGGMIADNKKSLNYLKIILMVVSIYIFIIPILQNSILSFVINLISNIKLGAVVATLLLFFVPSLLMGLVTPIIVKLKLDDIDSAGSVSGKMSAIATLGGIFGTFLGGFYLIPNFGSLELLFILTIIVLLLVPLVEMKLKSKSNIFVIIMIILAIVLFFVFSINNKNIGNDVLNGEYGKIYNYDTEYGRVSIYNEKQYAGNYGQQDIRTLQIGDGYESFTFVDEKLKYELYSSYTSYYNLAFESKIPINDVLMIGGAGYSYPKYYISHYLDKRMDVLEIDNGVTEIAKKYFYLDDLYEEFDLDENKRLNIYTDDGRIYLNKNKKKYDAIMNDAFEGSTPAKSLVTLEAVKMIKKSLNKDGVYLTNIIGTVEGKNSRFLKAEVNTIKQVFKYVYVVPCRKIVNNDEAINFMVVASDAKIDLDNVYDLDISKDEIIFTDNYCPVDKFAIEK